MPSPSHALATAAPAAQGDRLGWLLLIPLGFTVLSQFLLAWTGVIPVLDGALGDPDAYMRLNRVLHLHETGAWFDATYPRINPPEGHVQHWTRPLDALLLAGAWLLEPFLGFRTGLHLWGVLFSPVCLALSILALNWATAPVLDRDGRMIACLLLLLQPTVIGYSSLGRPDHHSLLFLLFILTIGFTGRLLLHETSRWTALAAGAVAALGIWVSTESLVFLATALTVLGLYWLGGDRAMAAHSARWTGWITAFLALGLLLERGPADIAAVETDRLSILHVAMFGLIATFWGAMAVVERFATTKAKGRILLTAVGTAGAAAILLLLFPEVRGGPLGEVDPLYKELRFDRILEVQPLIPLEDLLAGEFATVARKLIQGIGLAIGALPFLLLLLMRRADRCHPFWVGLAVPLVIFVALAIHQIRWSGYAQILLVIPYGALIALVIGGIGELRVPAQLRVLVRSLTLIIAVFWPIAAIASLPQQQIEVADRACPLAEVASVLNSAGRDSPRTVLALADYGPELLYRTPHRVLSIPNHRPQPGFTTTYRVLRTTNERIARAHLVRSDVGWILLCPSGTERNFSDPDQPEGSLYRRLLDGSQPTWVRPVRLPDGIRETARLFEVRLDPVGHRGGSWQ